MDMGRVLHQEPETATTLRRIPFVRGIYYVPAYDGSALESEGFIDLYTPEGPFHFAVQTKRSFLTRLAVEQLLAQYENRQANQSQGVILLARHIPRPVAERLIDANINFADDAGNVHLALGERYNWTVIGRPALEPAPEQRADSPAQLQLLFQFATDPESVNWPVRRLETAAGISKSKAAQAKRQMAAEGLLIQEKQGYKLAPMRLIAERLVWGYAQVLRPKLVLGRFRPPEKMTEAFLVRLSRGVLPGVRYSLSGGPAADCLQHFYHGPEAPLFLHPSTRTTAQQLRLLPDREGPVTILRAFGELVFWQERNEHCLAPPWLIYAELLTSSDPRAYEAAQELRREFLH
jgi:hypothetical protein